MSAIVGSILTFFLLGGLKGCGSSSLLPADVDLGKVVNVVVVPVDGKEHRFEDPRILLSVELSPYLLENRVGPDAKSLQTGAPTIETLSLKKWGSGGVQHVWGTMHQPIESGHEYAEDKLLNCSFRFDWFTTLDLMKHTSAAGYSVPETIFTKGPEMIFTIESKPLDRSKGECNL